MTQEYENINNLVSQKKDRYNLMLLAEVPVVSYVLIGINILIFVLLTYMSSNTEESQPLAYQALLDIFGNKDNAKIIAGEY